MDILRLEELPPEILFIIMTKLPYYQLQNYALTCKTIFEVCKANIDIYKSYNPYILDFGLMKQCDSCDSAFATYISKDAVAIDTSSNLMMASSKKLKFYFVSKTMKGGIRITLDFEYFEDRTIAELRIRIVNKHGEEDMEDMEDTIKHYLGSQGLERFSEGNNIFFLVKKDFGPLLSFFKNKGVEFNGC